MPFKRCTFPLIYYLQIHFFKYLKDLKYTTSVHLIQLSALLVHKSYDGLQATCDIIARLPDLFPTAEAVCHSQLHFSPRECHNLRFGSSDHRTRTPRCGECHNFQWTQQVKVQRVICKKYICIKLLRLMLRYTLKDCIKRTLQLKCLNQNNVVLQHTCCCVLKTAMCYIV